jgi:hypothetical protein
MDSTSEFLLAVTVPIGNVGGIFVCEKRGIGLCRGNMLELFVKHLCGQMETPDLGGRGNKRLCLSLIKQRKKILNRSSSVSRRKQNPAPFI